MTDATAAASPVMSDRLFSRLILGALVIGMLALAAIGGTAAWLVGKSRDYNHWVDHTYAAETKIYRLKSLLEQIETSRRGYLLTPTEPIWRAYAEARTGLPRTLGELDLFTHDNPVQQRNVGELWLLLDRRLAAMSPRVEAGRRGDAARARQIYEAGHDEGLVERTRLVTQRMVVEEARLLVRRTAEERRYADRLLMVVLAGVVLVAALALGSLWVIRRYAGDLNRSQSALRRLNEGLEEAVRDRTADLTLANEEIQRFAYIVSHDLRSPLVNVMGFTSELEVGLGQFRGLIERVEAHNPELVGRDVRLAVDSDLPEAIGFIRTSTRKMDRLINAILKLSREGRRSLNPESVDVGALAQGIADSLKHMADERGTEIVVEGAPPPVRADRLALEQVLSNLVENAVKYMQPNRPGRVAVRGRAEGARVVYEVQDNGRGIDPKDHERIFELFRRAGAQDQAGEGIGLAHVRALVHRLGGTITCVSTLDQGATFRLSLPATQPSEQRMAA